MREADKYTLLGLLGAQRLSVPVGGSLGRPNRRLKIIRRGRAYLPRAECQGYKVPLGGKCLRVDGGSQPAVGVVLGCQLLGRPRIA